MIEYDHELVERRGMPTKESAVNEAPPLLEGGYLVRIRKNPDGRRGARAWLLEAWAPADEEPSPNGGPQDPGDDEPPF